MGEHGLHGVEPNFWIFDTIKSSAEFGDHFEPDFTEREDFEFLARSHGLDGLYSVGLPFWIMATCVYSIRCCALRLYMPPAREPG